MDAKDKIKTNVQNVKTYTEDMVRVIEEDKEGLIKKIIKEQEQVEKEKRNTSPQSKKNRLFLSISLVLIFLALALLAFLFIRKNNQTVEVEIAKEQFTPLIFTDKVELSEVAGLTKEKIIENVLTQVNETEVKQGGIEGIYLTENGSIIGLRRFITLIKGSLVVEDPSLVSDNFLMGVVNNLTADMEPVVPLAKNFFILLKVRSFVDIFGIMRSWESKMFYDLHEFFGMDLNLFSNYLPAKNFEDGIVENKNARILYDNNGNIALVYIFVDENSLLIGSNLETTHEVMLRLSSSKIKK